MKTRKKKARKREERKQEKREDRVRENKAKKGESKRKREVRGKVGKMHRERDCRHCLQRDTVGNTIEVGSLKHDGY